MVCNRSLIENFQPKDFPVRVPRTADTLIKLYETYKNEGGVTAFKIARADLAGMVGTAPESVIRILSEFKADGLIVVDSSEISVLKPEEIAKIKF